MQMSLENYSEVAKTATPWASFSQNFLEEYLKSLKFGFDPSYQWGFRLYLKKAQEIGELDRIPALEFFNVLV